MYWGIGRHIGTPLAQNGAGDLLGHVRNEGATPAGKMLGANAARGYNSTAELGYHTDGDCGDIVTLFCLHPGKSGGVSTITSITRLHDELLAKRPDLLPAQYETQARFRLKEGLIGENSYRHCPTFSYYEGKLSSRFGGERVMLAHKTFAELGPVDPAFEEGSHLLDQWAADFHLDMHFQVGDLQLLNNYAIAHARTAFEDFEDPAQRRHLLRLWLNPREGRPLAPDFGRRGGVGVYDLV
jgi:hypothetical protein